MHVVYAAIHIEKLLNDLLQAHYFGSVDGGDGSKRDVRDSFRHDILETPALQFSFKRTLVTSLVKRCRLLKGKEADTLANRLKKWEEWRNAFAHGHIQYENDRGHIVRYYRGEPRMQALNDGFWECVESYFEEITTSIESANR